MHRHQTLFLLGMALASSLTVSAIALSAYSPADVVLDDLHSPVAAVRIHAATTAGERRLIAAVPRLLQLLHDDGDVRVRCAAARALGALRDSRATPALVDALKDDHPSLRREAASALGELQDPTASSALLQALKDEDYGVRDQAAWALTQIPDPKLPQTIAGLLQTPLKDRDHLLWMLRRLPAESALRAVAALMKERDAATRRRAVEALISLGPERSREALLRALDDSDAGVRLSAVRAVTRLGDRSLRPVLQRKLQRERDPQVQAALKRGVYELSQENTLVGYWPFEDGGRDASNHGNDGEVRDCRTVPGKVGKALQFGEGKFVELGQPAGLPIGNREFTVMAWVKSEQPNGVVIARGGAYCGFSLYVKDRLPKFGIHRVQAGPAYIASGKQPLPAGWVHLAGVLRRQAVEVYVNGKLAGSAKVPGLIPGNCGQGMEIGFDVSNSSCEITDAWTGVIDEVKFYHAAFTTEEIAEQYAAAQP